MRVLLVHPQDEARRMLASSLGRDVVVEAASGAEALRALRWCGALQVAIIHGPALGMAPGDLARELQKQQAGLPVVAVGWPEDAETPRDVRRLPAGTPLEALMAVLDGIHALPVSLPIVDAEGRQAPNTDGSPYCATPTQVEGLLIVASLEGRVVFLNRAAQALFDVDDLEGLTLARFSRAWDAPLPDGGPQTEIDLILPGGGSLPACQTFSRIAEAGHDPRIVIAVRPLATHCPRLGEVLASEQRFRVLFEELHIGLLVQDRDDRILLSNPMACQLLGVTPAQLHGKSSFDPDWNVIREDGTAFEPQEHPSVVAMRTGKTVREVVMGVYRPGSRDRVWILVTADPVKNSDGNLDRVIVSFSDITQYRALKEGLDRAKRFESIGALASGVAHDFNNVLAAIMACGDSLLVESDPAQARLLMEEVLRTAERGAAFTRQLLTLGHGGTGESEDVVLDATVEGLLSFLRRSLSNQVVLETELATEGRSVRMDGAELERALLNLVVNARDAQPEGGRVRISTRTIPGEGDAPPLLELAVQDEGSGIPEEAQSHIFEPLFTTKGAAGTGLGLATVFGAVTGAGGTVDFETSSRGTTFRIRLPASGGGPAPSARARPPGRRRGRVLVADDDALLRDQVQRYLEQEGYPVTAASDGAEALRLAKLHRDELCLVLSDVVMPGISGLALRAQIQDELRVPVALFSGNPFPDAGGSTARPHILTKPFTRTELLDFIEGVIPAHDGDTTA